MWLQWLSNNALDIYLRKVWEKQVDCLAEPNSSYFFLIAYDPPFVKELNKAQ